MQKNKIFEVALSVILIILSFLTVHGEKAEDFTSALKLPEKLKDFEGREIALSKYEENFIKETGAIIEKKKYGIYIVTLICGNEAKQLHSPVTCYEAMGYKMVSEEIFSLTPSLKITGVVFDGDKRETLYFWFFKGNLRTPSFSDVFIQSAKGEKGWSLISVASQEEDVPVDVLLELDKYFAGELLKSGE